jgi:hypothetical protein
MTVLERKAVLIQAILNNTDENMLADMELLLYAKQKPPCQYTIEEVKEGIRKSIEDVGAGRIIPHEEVKKRFAL